MGDHETGSACHQILHAFLNQCFGNCIHGTGRFIHNEDFRFPENCTSKADELFLTHGKQVASFSNFIIVALV